MSAICGIYRRDARDAAAPEISGLMHALRHRGPDGGGERECGPVRLGHLLLEVAPESCGERQPLHDSESGRTITADARVDNRDELMHSLGLTPRAGEVTTDCSLILAAYGKWGERCLDHIEGDFVFAIWDERENRLFCARDAVGMRVLYFYQDARIFAFASELGALLALPDLPRELDDPAIGDYLIWNKADVRSTFYSHIKRLPPGHSLTVGPDTSSERRFWSAALKPELSFSRDEEYAEALRELLDRAVVARLRTAHPVGATLSGGLDSSAIAAIAENRLREGGSSLRVYSSVLKETHEGPERDERSFIDSMCAAMGWTPSYVYGDRDTFLGSLARMTREMGQAFPDPFWYMSDALNEAASGDGVRVLLSGVGGDHAASFDGRGYLASLARRGRLFELSAQISRRQAVTGKPAARILMGEALLPLLPHRLFGAYARIRSGAISPDIIARSAISEEFAERIGLRQRSAASGFSRSWRTLPDPRVNLVHRLDAGNVANILECLTVFGAAKGMELSCPLLDRRILDFCLAVPPRQFVLEGVHRSLLRRATAGLLPDQVRLRRDKGAFTPDYHRRLLESRADIHELLASLENTPIWSYLDKAKVEAQLQRVRRPESQKQWEIGPQMIVGTGLQLAAFFQNSNR